MPTFQFEAMDSTGAEIKDVIEAPSEEDAQATIRQMGYFVTKITVKKSRKKAEAAGAATKKRGFVFGSVASRGFCNGELSVKRPWKSIVCGTD